MLKLFEKVSHFLHEIHTEKIEFPNGETRMVLENEIMYPPYILWHFESNSEFIELAQLVDTAESFGQSPTLIMPYIPYSREDRKEDQSSFGLRMFCIALDALSFNKIIVIDPHSDVSGGMIGLYQDIDIYPQGLISSTSINRLLCDYPDLVLVCPDAGAEKKFHKICKEFPELKRIFIAKKRNAKTGEIESIDVAYKDDFEVTENTHYLILDDICSKGGTFLGIKIAIESTKENTSLYITHYDRPDWIEKISKQFSSVYLGVYRQEFKEENIINVFESEEHFLRFLV